MKASGFREVDLGKRSFNRRLRNRIASPSYGRAASRANTRAALRGCAATIGHLRMSPIQFDQSQPHESVPVGVVRTSRATPFAYRRLPRCFATAAALVPTAVTAACSCALVTPNLWVHQFTS